MVNLVERGHWAVKLIRIVLAQKSVQLLWGRAWSGLVLTRDKTLFIVQLSATTDSSFLIDIASSLKRRLIEINVMASTGVETMYFLSI